MEGGGSELRSWDELIPDALGIIFRNLSLQELLTVIPRVCKSWGKAVAGPYCWQEIDIEDWSTYCPPEHVLPMVRMLMTRSGESLRKLCVSNLPTDEAFSFIADHVGSIHELRISRSEISNSIVEKCAPKLSNITFLDVSYCLRIEASAIEAIGKHCKSLSVLHRVMHPLTVDEKVSQDDEAEAMAATMPKLKQLELAYALVSTEPVLKIILNCRQLEYLDLRGCWNVKLDEDFLKEKFPGLKVLGPIVEDSYELELYENCTDFSETSSYLAWEVLAHELDEHFNEDDSDSFDEAWDDDEQRLEQLELRFYEGFNGAGAVGDAWPAWPASL